MNELSRRLHAALGSPPIKSIRPSTSNYPSSVSTRYYDQQAGCYKVLGTCLRSQYYRRKGYAPTDDKDLNWSLSASMGNYLHEMLTDLIEENAYRMGITRIGKEISFYDDSINLSGRIDYLAWDAISKELIGIEIKTVGDWKSKKCIVKPAEDHVMQAILYLDFFKRRIPEGQVAPTRWYIWYVARSENWDLKGAKNTSPFTQMWDFYVTLKDGCPTVVSPSGVETWTDITVEDIKNRYIELEQKLAVDELPPRDYELKYSEEKILGMYKLDRLEYKKDKTAVEKWIKNGTKPGELELDMGDFECRACPHVSECWNLTSGTVFKSFDLPKAEVTNSIVSEKINSIL